MLMHESMELIKKYGECPECGNDKVGGEPSQGALIIEDEVLRVVANVVGRLL